MSRRWPLRHRIAFATTMVGLALSLLLAAAVALLAEDYEYVLANEILQGQAEDYSLRLANGLPATLPDTHRLSGYRIDAPDLPAAYRHYPLGVHEDGSDDGLHVGVFDTAAGRLVFIANLSDIEALELHLHLFLAGMVVLGTLTAGWLGWLLSGLALRPLRGLTEGVEALPAEPRATRLAEAVSADELGRLAQAIDAYQARLVAADAREQAFFADASHELRTPLAVIQGVTEVLLDDPPAGPGMPARLQRLDRGVREMRQLLEAMLAAARRQPVQHDVLPAAPLLAEAAAIALAGKPAIRAAIDAGGDLHAPHREALLLVAGLGRKLAQAHSAGTLHLHAEAAGLSIRMAPDPAVEEGPPRHARADTATGSALLDRLAQRLGWQVVFESASRVAIRFPAAVPSADVGAPR